MNIAVEKLIDSNVLKSTNVKQLFQELRKFIAKRLLAMHLIVFIIIFRKV